MKHEDEMLMREILTVTGASWGYMDATPKLLSHPKRLALFLQGKDEELTPVNIEIWPSRQCNARCPKCPYRVNAARQDADRRNAATRLTPLEILPQTDKDGDREHLMRLELWSKIAKEFRDLGGDSVTFTGGGEPTEHPQLPEFGRVARQQGLYWGLYSNGYNMIPPLIDRLLEHAPEFIRISINSWSPASHDWVYHLGLEAYNRVQNNLLYLARHAPSSTTIGIGYVVDHTTPEKLKGISQFIESVCQKQARLDYVTVRPELLYYHDDGSPRSPQPEHERFAPVPELCRQILDPVCNAYGVALHINDRSFQAIAEAQPPSSCLATMWTTSVTESGKLYLLSEANGSPKPKLAELCYGDISGETTFQEAWNGNHRRTLTREFASGARVAPVWHKLSGIDEALRMLRSRIGIVKPEVANQVANALAEMPKPKHWMFI